jgi:hypothetical protein
MRLALDDIAVRFAQTGRILYGKLNRGIGFTGFQCLTQTPKLGATE